MADNPQTTPEERRAFKAASAFLTGLASASRALDAGTRDAAPGRTEADQARDEMIRRYERVRR